MWNLVASETREGEVFLRLLTKLEKMANELGGKVFDVLGDEIFEGARLRELLIEAVRYGEQPEVRSRLEQIVDAAVSEKLRAALKERALLSEMMSATEVERIRERMEEAEARKLQPHFIRAFFLEAFKLLGGQIAQREPGRYEITHVPADIRNRARTIGAGLPVVSRYARVTFEKSLVAPAGQHQAQFLTPGHPLLDATVDLVLERYRPLLKKGAVLVAPADESEDPRALVYVEHAIQNAKELRDGQRQVVSKRLEFVELTQDWEPRVAGYAPYLDYRPLEEDELELVRPLIEEEWLDRGVERAGLDYAIAVAVPQHLAEVREETLRRVAQTKEAVHRRLTTEIAYWDHRAQDLKEQELAGKKPRMSSGRARQRANDLEERYRRRMEELEREGQLSSLPPVVVGGALVIPQGLLERLRGERATEPDVFARETRRVEQLAVDAVLAAERQVGRQPRVMPPNNPGYDVISRDPVTGERLFIEVKGRVAGAPTFTMTRNEILTSLNKPRDWVLALVEVDGDRTEVRYLREPFVGPEDAYFAMTSANYPWREFFERGEPPRPSERPPLEHWLEIAVKRVVAGFAPEQIVLFGSRARGEERDGSDVDLLVVLPEVTDHFDDAVSIRRALSDLPIAKDVVVASPEDVERSRSRLDSVIRTALDEGKVLYARG